MNATKLKSEVYYNNVNDFLGNPEKRYLSKRFSDISFQITDMTFGLDFLDSLMLINKVNSISYSHKKHFGSIEALSIASILTEIFIIGRFHICDKDIRNLKVKEIYFSVNKAKEVAVFNSSVSCTAVEDDISLFKFIARVQNFTIVFNIDIPYVQKHTWDIDKVDMFMDNVSNRYNTGGYKKTKINIEDLYLDLEDRNISSRYSVINDCNNSGLIIGNSKKLSQIDFIRISGQLIQTLLYNLEGTSREEASNMWVKSLRIVPSEYIKENISISFTEFRNVKLKNEQWRVLNTSIQIGHLVGSMKLCHKIN